MTKPSEAQKEILSQLENGLVLWNSPKATSPWWIAHPHGFALKTHHAAAKAVVSRGWAERTAAREGRPDTHGYTITQKGREALCTLSVITGN